MQSHYQAQGMTAEQVVESTTNFLNGIRDAQTVARSFIGNGVTDETLHALNTLMQTLGVAPW